MKAAIPNFDLLSIREACSQEAAAGMDRNRWV